MRLYGAIQKVEPQDDGTVRVHGIASSEVVDDQGEIVRADAMRAAMPDYMRFPALREMHQLSAAGTTLEAEVGDDGATRIVAHVVDPIAITKVRNQVYRGFSIGGRVTQREAGNPKAITGLVLNEISLVDRPANPEAIFDCWKASAVSDATSCRAESPLPATVPPAPTREPFNLPTQIWACGVADHHHRGKGDAVKCLEGRALGAANVHLPPSPQTTLTSPPVSNPEADCATKTEVAIGAAKRAIETAEGALARTDGRENGSMSSSLLKDHREPNYADPGYQPDGKRRYPVDTERHIRAAWNYINRPSNAQRYTTDQVGRIRATIIAAWKEKIDIEGPPSAAGDEKASSAALTKALCDVGHVAQIIHDLDWLQDALEVEAAIEGDDSPQPARLQSIISELCGFLNALVAEETGELLGDAQMDDACLPQRAAELIAMTASAPGAARIAALLKTGNPRMQKLAAALLAKAKHSQGDQALVDMALCACDRCLKIDGPTVEEKTHLARARDHLREAGGAPSETSSLHAAGNIEHVAPQVERRHSISAAATMPRSTVQKGRALLQRRAVNAAVPTRTWWISPMNASESSPTGWHAFSCRRVLVWSRRLQETLTPKRSLRLVLAILPKRWRTCAWRTATWSLPAPNAMLRVSARETTRALNSSRLKLYGEKTSPRCWLTNGPKRRRWSRRSAKWRRCSIGCRSGSTTSPVLRFRH